jgi:Ca2+-binding RTX toxin-like protein
MLHGQTSPANFNADHSDNTVRVAMPENGTAGHVTIPDTELLFSAKFTQAGSDLVLTGEDGHKVVVSGYFDHERHADLVAPGGASLSADLVAKLTIPQMPMHYAQAGAPVAGVVIGHVERLGGGRATVQHANGNVEELRIGDNVYQGDVVETAGGAQLGLSLNDGTAFNMGANARMVLNEFVYDSASNANSGLFSLVKGSISFVAGQVAKTGDMRVETPVATMGIRGTTVNTNITADIGGNLVSVTYSLMVDPDGHVGSFNLIDKVTGAIIGTITTTDTTFVITPTANLGVLATQLDKTPEQVQIELGIAQVLFPIFLSNPANFLTNPNNINPNDLQPKNGIHGSSGYLDYHGHGEDLGVVDTLHVRPYLTVAETIIIQVTDQNGITQTSTETIPVTLPSNLLPLINVDTPPHLVEAAGFDFGVRTSTANITKSDIDGTASYDTAALLADHWIDLGNGIYSKLGIYGAATLNTVGVSGSTLTTSGWFYIGNGTYEKFGVDFGSGNFENVKVKLGADTLTYALDNFKADSLGDNDHPTDNFTIPVIDTQGGQSGATAVFTIDGANDAPHITTGNGPFADYDVTEGTRYVTTVKAQDPEGDTLTYSIAPGGFDSNFFKIDPVTGVLAFKVAPDFEFPHDFFHNNTYFANVVVDDGHGGIDVQSIEVDVTNLQNEVTGNGFNNVLNGISNRTNYLSGLGGNDTLNGKNRSDVLVGGSGNDTMTGGGGTKDTFVFNPNFGKDKITDFRTGSDVIEIDHSLFTSVADLVANHTTDIAGNAVIEFDVNNTITLIGVLKANLVQTDFHLV